MGCWLLCETLRQGMLLCSSWPCTVTLRIPVHEDDGVDNKPVVGHVSRMLDALLLKTPVELANGGDVPGLTSRVVTQPAAKLTALPAMTSFGTFSVEQSAAGVPADVGRKSSSTSIFSARDPLMNACRISHGSCTGSASLLSCFLLCLNHPRVQASETGRSVFFHTKPAQLLLKRNALLRFERLHNLTTSIPGLNASTAPCTLALPLDRKSFALSTSYVFLQASATRSPTICSASCSSVSPVGLNAQQLSLDTVLVKRLVFVRNGAQVFVFHAVGIDARELALGLVLITLQKWRKGPRMSCPLAARFAPRAVPTPIQGRTPGDPAPRVIPTHALGHFMQIDRQHAITNDLFDVLLLLHHLRRRQVEPQGKLYNSERQSLVEASRHH